MTYVALALSLACAVLVWLWQSARRSAGDWRATADERAGELAEAENQIVRLEGVIDAKRREVARLAEDLAGCNDPAAAVSLARRLLLDPWRGDPPVPRR